MGVDTAFTHQQGTLGRQRREALGGGKVGAEAPQVAVVDPDHTRAEAVGALHFGLVVDFDQHVHPAFERGGLHLGHVRVVERGDDDQDGVGADRAGFGDLPRIDHEVLAQHRQ